MGYNAVIAAARRLSGAGLLVLKVREEWRQSGIEEDYCRSAAYYGKDSGGQAGSKQRRTGSAKLHAVSMRSGRMVSKTVGVSHTHTVTY
jgi:hypothetical protein